MNASTAKRAIKRHRQDSAQHEHMKQHARKILRLPRNFSAMGPVARIRLMRESKQAPSRIERYIQGRAQENLMKQIRRSLPALSSALNCYADFCDLEGNVPFPPTEQLVLDRSAFFADAATYMNYVSHLRKICFPARCHADGRTPAVRHVARGLGKCQDRSFRFPNSTRSRLVARIVHLETLQSEFAQARMLSFLRAFRVPSEALHLVRAFSNGPVNVFSELRGRSHRDSRNAGRLGFVHLSKGRGDITGGCIFRRPCFSP